jgi:hypothetical protein
MSESAERHNVNCVLEECEYIKSIMKARRTSRYVTNSWNAHPGLLVLGLSTKLKVMESYHVLLVLEEMNVWGCVAGC